MVQEGGKKSVVLMDMPLLQSGFRWPIVTSVRIGSGGWEDRVIDVNCVR